MGSRDKLQVEVKDLKKKVRSLEDDLKKSQDSSGKHFNLLNDFYNKVKPLVDPPARTEDKSSETIPMVNGVSGEETEADNKVKDEGSDVKDVPMEGEETKS